MQGVIDEGTLVWGQGLADWLPVRNVRTLVPQIRTLEGEDGCMMPGVCGSVVSCLLLMNGHAHPPMLNAS